MAKLFYWFFRVTGKYKLISVIIFLAIVGLALRQAFQLKFEENIVAIMPQDENVGQVAEVFEGFKMNRRLVLHLYNNRQTGNPQILIETAQTISNNLQGELGKSISEIKLTIPDSQIEVLYNYYHQNIPFYLLASDYDSLKSRVTDAGIAQTLEQFHKSLMSPMGMVTRNLLVKDPFGLTNFPLERARDLQLDQNFALYKNHLITEDQNHLVFFLELANPPNETAENGRLIKKLDQLALKYSDETLQVEYFGAAAVAVANATQIKKDVQLTVTLALVGLFIFISLFYRNLYTFFIVVTPGAFGGLLSIALLSLLKEQVSIISLAVGSVLLGITIDYALHLFTHAKKEHDVKQLFEDISVTMLMSSLTTACAFFSLLFLRSTALQDLGLFAGTSVIAAALYTLIVLPHFVSKGDKSTKKPNWVERVTGTVAIAKWYKNKFVLIAILVLTVGSLFTWKNIGFESDMQKLNYMPDHLAAFEQNINEVSSYSANNIYLSTNGEHIWDALSKNKKVVHIIDSLKNKDEIFDYLTLNKLVPTREKQQERLRQWDQFWRENNKQEVLEELNAQAVNMGFSPNTFTEFKNLIKVDQTEITAESLSKLMSVFGDDLIIENEDGTVAILTTIKLPLENKSKVFELVSSIPEVVILDRGYLTNKLVTLLNEDFNHLVNISLGIVFLIILLSYGRIELALMTFLPILLSWLWVLGIMGLVGLKFNIVNIIICTFIFGLGIDYSIFIMRGLIQKYKHGADNIESYKKSILLSVVTTLVGIGVLAFAQHPALKSIAFLAVVGIVSVVVITFTVEQMLFNIFLANRKKKGVTPFTLFSLIITIVAFLYFLLGCLILQIVRLVFLVIPGMKPIKKHTYHWLMMFFCRTLVYMMANFPKKIVDKQHADFDKPSVLIANHHSFIDILIMLMFSPKVVMVTNDWVYNSPFFGKPVQYADFIWARKGVDNQLEKIKKLVDKGYSIIVFPEGTRTGSFKLRRFHKGAFFLAEQLKLDIQPVVLHGTNLVMPKGDDFYLKNNLTTIKFLPRIKHDDLSFGEGYAERTKKISKYFKAEYNKVRRGVETPTFFKEILIKNYLFKGPILEWYTKVKVSMEKNYELFHEMIPKNASLMDLGCGNGTMSMALALSGEQRVIKGIDYDEDKIKIAKNCSVLPSNLSFEQGDVMTANFDNSDVFILSDVLHYLEDDEQNTLMKKMSDHLNENGKIIIRDGDSDKTKRHKGTQLTEIFSTNFGFNKARNQMNYISADFIRSFATENNYRLEIIDNTKRTSNTVFVLTKK